MRGLPSAGLGKLSEQVADRHDATPGVALDRRSAACDVQARRGRERRIQAAGSTHVAASWETIVRKT
jgi:hypothetical protein